MSFTLEHDPVDSGHLVVAEGELDITATNELSTVLAMAGASPERSVVLDLMAVDFIDSSALGVIMRSAGSCWSSRPTARSAGCWRSRTSPSASPSTPPARTRSRPPPPSSSARHRRGDGRVDGDR
jgi:anti-anti-sigma factor